MTTYNIHFTNKYSQGDDSQNYALFCDIPVVSSSTGNPKVYANAFLTTSLVNGGGWDITITKDYYAWCGSSPQTLAPGVVVQVGQGKLATLGTASNPGSTFEMYNNQGNPAFKSTVTYTANQSAFEIDTGTDFTPNMGFLMGLGGMDGSGRMKPLATLAAPANSIVNIAPVTKFYLAAYSASQGSIINTSAASKVAATIDFTVNPGQFGAVVTQGPNGAFTVNYVNQPQFVMAVAAAQSEKERYGLQLKHLRHQISSLLSLVDNALSATSGPMDTLARYNCSLSWVFNPTQAQMLAVLNSLIASMSKRMYHYEGGSVIGSLKSQFTHALPVDVAAATRAWLDSYGEIPNDYRKYITDPRTVPANTTMDTDDTTAFQEQNGLQQNGSTETSALSNGNGIASESTADGSLEAKKQRALQLLQAEGLGAFGGSMLHA